MNNEKTDQLRGRIKQAAGDLTGDNQMKKEGERREQAGKLKEGISRLHDKANKTIDQAQEKMNKRNDRQ